MMRGGQRYLNENLALDMSEETFHAMLVFLVVRGLFRIYDSKRQKF